MKEIEFFDVKEKNKFKTSKYEIKEKNGRFFAVTKSPKGTHECWKILSAKQAAELKK